MKILESLGATYPRYVNREITVRDRTGKEYHGVLRKWGDHDITLQNGSQEIVVNRRNDNIVSLWTDTNGSPPSRKEGP
jgi:hypothetical protein